jgi:DNA-binding NarL/FixJ family response regulator
LAPLIRVSIIDGDETARGDLVRMIDAAHGYACVGAYRMMEEALRRMRSAAPDVVLLDIDLPGLLSSEAVRVLRQRHPSAELLMLTADAGHDKLVEWICHGASGYLVKNTPPERLLAGIREVRDGGAPISPEIARKLVDLFHATHRRYESNGRLTPQEVRLLQLLADGFNYGASANRLDITVNTVRNYIRSIYEKLHVHSKSEAVSKGLRGGIIT